MGAVTIQQMADRVSALMEERLRLRGSGLAEKLRKGGRLLPRRVRAQAQLLAEAAAMAQSPKLRVQIDESEVAEAYDICVRHLNGVNAGARFWNAARGTGISIAFALLGVGVLIFAVLIWRGYLLP